MDNAQAALTYVNMTDEASAADFTRGDFGPDALEMADQFASQFDLPKFDELADVDQALQLMEEAGLLYLLDSEPRKTSNGLDWI